MINDNRPLDVFIGEEFFKLTGVHGGYFYSKENKVGFCSTYYTDNQYIYILVDSSTPLYSGMLSVFLKKYVESLLPEFNIVVRDFQRVDKPDECARECKLNELGYEGDKTLKKGDFLICFELERTDEALKVTELFDAVNGALDEVNLGTMPYTYTGGFLKSKSSFIFYSSKKTCFDQLVQQISIRLKNSHWRIKHTSPEAKLEIDDIYSYVIDIELKMNG